MRPLRYSINLTLDGCVDHRVGVPDEASHRHSGDAVAASDLVFGRKTYELMEFWRPLAQPGAAVPEGMKTWMMAFAHDIDKARKYLVSTTIQQVEWNTTLLAGDLETAIRELKAQAGKPLLTGGVNLALQLAELGLIDEYEFIVQPRIVGHGPTLFAGLSKVVELELVDRKEVPSGSAVVLRYRPRF